MLLRTKPERFHKVLSRAYPETINHSTIIIQVVVFKEVDDRLWAKIEPFLPDQKPKTGRPRADLRKTFNGILYVVKTGISWSDVPKMYGAKSTVHRLHLELCTSGAYLKINQIFISESYLSGKIDLSCCNIDTKSVKAKKGRNRL